MTNEELKTTLETNGLSSYQAELYVTLLELQEASVGELADASSVPQSRIYDVLRDLKEQGYVETYKQGKLLARAAEPDVVVSELREKSVELTDAADEIEELWERPELRHSEISVFDQTSTLFGNAKESIRQAENKLHMSLAPEQIHRLETALRDAHSNDVLIEISIHESRGESRPVEEIKPLLHQTATEVRRLPSLAPQMVLIDGEVAYLAVREGYTNQYGIQVSDHVLTSMLHWYFQIQLWETLEVIYADSEEGNDTYVNIREFIRDVESFKTTSDEILVTVRGYSTRTGQAVTHTGTVANTIYADDSTGNENEDPFSNLYIHASFILETDSGAFSVGGYGAVKEDIRATLIEVESV